VAVPVLKNFIEVGNRLDKLGTSREMLIETAEAMAAAGAECTENDPSGARGWRRWQMGTRRSRELHCPGGEWQRDETDQVASIMNARLGLRLVVVNTDDGTCIEGRRITNRSKKGAATDRAVDENQASFFDYGTLVENVTPIRAGESASPDRLTTWHYCVYHEGDDLRAELTCFTSAPGGFLASPRERIFIIGGESEPPDLVKKPKPDAGSDFDIPVTRKK
jgi:hypothetical protein